MIGGLQAGPAVQHGNRERIDNGIGWGTGPRANRQMAGLFTGFCYAANSGPDRIAACAPPQAVCNCAMIDRSIVATGS